MDPTGLEAEQVMRAMRDLSAALWRSFSLNEESEEIDYGHGSLRLVFLGHDRTSNIHDPMVTMHRVAIQAEVSPSDDPPVTIYHMQATHVDSSSFFSLDGASVVSVPEIFQVLFGKLLKKLQKPVHKQVPLGLAE